MLTIRRTFSGNYRWDPSHETNFTPSGAAKGQSGMSGRGGNQRSVYEAYT